MAPTVGWIALSPSPERRVFFSRKALPLPIPCPSGFGRAAALAALLALPAAPDTAPPAEPPSIIGLARVATADTLEIDGLRLPLAGIAVDSARRIQARLLLEALTAPGPVRCAERPPGRWRCRTLAPSGGEAIDLAAALVQSGCARSDGSYSHSEQLARSAGVGLWAASAPGPD